MTGEFGDLFPVNSVTMETGAAATGVSVFHRRSMDHYRQRKYRGPETWRRVREAYAAGESGPSVAMRFDVGLANLRKKAMREGWTRNCLAVASDRALPPRREERSTTEAPTRTTVGAPREMLAAIVGDRDVSVIEALYLAGARSASLLAEGRAGEANALITAISNLAKLSGMTADAKHQAVLRNLLLDIDPDDANANKGRG